jgi:hypothetical protein
MAFGVFAQGNSLKEVKSQEVSEEDGIPVLAKHLPDWENVRNGATYILNSEDLRKTLGNRPVLEMIEFESGTEAVTAKYDAGKLLIVEYPTPQGSVDADSKIKQKLAEEQNSQIFYRRIGNYNAFVFDGKNETTAKALLDQVKYEKEIQWLGYNPFAIQKIREEEQKAERAFVLQTADLFFATIQVIVGGLGLSIILGLIVGIVFFFKREQQRAAMETYTDAGGMTRLNLDGFTPEIPIDRLLKE